MLKIKEDAILPQYATSNDSGLDLFSNDSLAIEPKEWRLVHTGIAIELPLKHEAQIRPRSGLALNHGITVLNSPGTIDQGYRGEICVLLINFGSERFLVEKGMKVAQLVLTPITKVKLRLVTKLVESERGISGFGSTGLYQKDGNESD